jgi:hypothetical protein
VITILIFFDGLCSSDNFLAGDEGSSTIFLSFSFYSLLRLLNFSEPVKIFGNIKGLFVSFVISYWN